MLAKSLTFLALGAGSLAVQFDGPSQTHAADPLVVNLDGRSPRPTENPRSLPLFRRQTDEGICGFLDGDNEYPVSCTIGTCAYEPSNSWFGCCTGTAIDDCNIFTTCIASASLSACSNDPACASDALALGCTAASAPNCMTMLSSVPEGTVSHFVCGESTGVIVDVLPTGTGVAGSDSASASATGLSRTLSATATGRTTTSARRTTTSELDDETSTEEPTAEETSDDTGDEPSSQRPTRTTSTRQPWEATPGPSTAGAVRTAQAVAAAAGGMVGVLAWML